MAKGIKLVAVDLDSTLLRSDGTVSAFTVEVFRRLRMCQIKVCVLTARRKASAEPICKQLACQGAAFYNGAIVCAEKGIISLHTMNRQVADAILSTAKEHPCSVSCKDGSVYTNFRTQHCQRQ